jgi:hypothetical protein
MKKYKIVVIVFSITILAGDIFSAPPPPPSGGPGCWPPPCIPIDNGLVFLVLAGVAFGAKKIYSSYKKSSTAC